MLKGRLCASAKDTKQPVYFCCCSFLKLKEQWLKPNAGSQVFFHQCCHGCIWNTIGYWLLVDLLKQYKIINCLAGKKNKMSVQNTKCWTLYFEQKWSGRRHFISCDCGYIIFHRFYGEQGKVEGFFKSKVKNIWFKKNSKGKHFLWEIRISTSKKCSFFYGDKFIARLNDFKIYACYIIHIPLNQSGPDWVRKGKGKVMTRLNQYKEGVREKLQRKDKKWIFGWKKKGRWWGTGRKSPLRQTCHTPASMTHGEGISHFSLFL